MLKNVTPHRLLPEKGVASPLSLHRVPDFVLAKMSKQGNVTFQKELQQIRKDKITGKLVKRFQDEFFALDLLKVNDIGQKLKTRPCKRSLSLQVLTFTNRNPETNSCSLGGECIFNMKPIHFTWFYIRKYTPLCLDHCPF